MMDKNLNASVRYLKGIGPGRAKSLNNVGIVSIEDLIYYFPRRYQDRTSFTTISRLEEGQVSSIKGTILGKKERRSFRRRRFTITEVVVDDGTGKITCVWFNQPYIKDYFKTGESAILYGRVDRYGAKLQINSPEFEILEDDQGDPEEINRLVPVYSLPDGMSQRYFRKVMKGALEEFMPQVKEYLPFDMRDRNRLMNLAKAILEIHFPGELSLQKEAYKRLSFDEFFLFQIPIILRKIKKKNKAGIAHQTEGPLVETFLDNLPFRLTQGQIKAVEEIKRDMSSSVPMQRLLQGDVGSGKTIVSFIACIMAIQGGYQAAFMVPTEVLARQHYEKIKSQVASHMSQVEKTRIGLLTGSGDKKEKDALLKAIKEGKIDFVIGTHALLEGSLEFKNLGLVVIDEQHKFGVGQRALLPAKGKSPDVLIMTATPIPRTLAITLYGDLDISVINEMPAGRKPVTTLNFSRKEVLKAHAILRQQLESGHQAFIVYPVIEESYALDIEGAKKMYEQFKSADFKDFSVGLMHGRLQSEEQEEVMAKFKKGELDILVSTTVMEVGIDIPNATCIVIEHAERFGLAQLHQLRGRVGRGKDESFCVLISDARTPDAEARILAMVKNNDGFRIAEDDLKIRGPGEFFGSRQHGLSELKIANPLTQMQLLKKAREEARKLLESDPQLEAKQDTLLKSVLLSRFPEYEKLMIVG